MNTELEQIKNQNYTLNTGEVLNESWKVYSKALGFGALAVIIYSVVSFAVTKIFSQVTGLAYAEKELQENIQGVSDFNVLMQEVQFYYVENMYPLIYTSLLSSLIMLLAFPLAGGFMLVCREIDTKGYANISTLFEGFKSKYWGRLMALAVVYFILSKIAALLFLLPAIYFWVAAVIACPFVMFTSASGIDALKASVKLVNKDWFGVFKILFVASLFGILGYFLCGAGRIATYPFVLTTVYMLYKYIVGFQNEEISKIGEN